MEKSISDDDGTMIKKWTSDEKFAHEIYREKNVVIITHIKRFDKFNMYFHLFAITSKEKDLFVANLFVIKNS